MRCVSNWLGWWVTGIVAACSLFPVSIRADAVIVTKAMTASTIMEVYIEEGEVVVDLEIGTADFQGFRNLLPSELLEKMGEEHIEPLKVRLPRFFMEDLRIRIDGGNPLPGRLMKLEGRRRVPRDEVTGEPLPVDQDEGEPVIFAKLAYPFDGQPEKLSIQPPMEQRAGRVAPGIGFITYHHGLPVMDFRYLGQEETIRLDWEDPWYSQFDNRNLWRAYREPINTFIYVEPFEVRAEIIVRPFDMENWIDLGLEGLKTIPVEMQPRIKEQITEFIANRLDLKIDGVPFKPTLDRVNFLRRTLRNSTIVDPPEELDVYSATLGLIFVQSTEGLPNSASISWDLFSPKMDRVRAAAVDEAGPLPCFLTPDATVLMWNNYLKNPTIPTVVAVAPPPSLALKMASPAAWAVVAFLAGGWAYGFVGGRRSRSRAVVFAVLITVTTLSAVTVTQQVRLTHERAETLMSAMLKNIYHAFDFSQEELIYDTLAHSVDGDLLTKIYLETRKGLELASQGGARVKVKGVDILEVEPRSGRQQGFAARVRWNVRGSVGHWGHVHQRTNQYEAEFDLQPVDGHWKITQMEILQEERIL